MVQQCNLGDKINERDNLGGTRYFADKWIIELCEVIDPNEFVNTMFKYGTQKLNNENDHYIIEKVDNYIQILKTFYHDLEKQNAYKSNLSEPGDQSSQAIFFRYCSKKNLKYPD